jgi:hypothetical protein
MNSDYQVFSNINDIKDTMKVWPWYKYHLGHMIYFSFLWQILKVTFTVLKHFVLLFYANCGYNSPKCPVEDKNSYITNPRKWKSANSSQNSGLYQGSKKLCWNNLQSILSNIIEFIRNVGIIWQLVAHHYYR